MRFKTELRNIDVLLLRNYSSGAVQDSNLVHVISMTLFRASFTLTRPSADTTHLQGTATPTTSYVLQTSTSPAAAGFANTATLMADASGNIFYDDLNPGAMKFYRLILP